MTLEQEIRFYIPLELTRLTAMSSLIGNHTMNLSYLLKENFKNLLLDLLITRRSFENFSYQVVRCRRDEDSEEYAGTYYEALNQTLLTQKHKSIGVASQYILRSGSSWHRLNSSMLKNRRSFSLVISKLMSAFSL